MIIYTYQRTRTYKRSETDGCLLGCNAVLAACIIRAIDDGGSKYL
jgi:hypothetical protein